MNTFENAINELAPEVAQLVIKKHRDYSAANILDCPIDPRMGVLVRLNDKLRRLGNLLSNDKNPNNESIRDTWADIVGYGLIGLMLEDETFQLPLKEE